MGWLNRLRVLATKHAGLRSLLEPVRMMESTYSGKWSSDSHLCSAIHLQK